MAPWINDICWGPGQRSGGVSLVLIYVPNVSSSLTIPHTIHTRGYTPKQTKNKGLWKLAQINVAESPVLTRYIVDFMRIQF